jgi:hypothetical protein
MYDKGLCFLVVDDSVDMQTRYSIKGLRAVYSMAARPKALNWDMASKWQSYYSIESRMEATLSHSFTLRL